MKILVALDGSDNSSRALEFIEARQWHPADEFLLVSVVEPDKADVSMSQAITSTDNAIFSDAEKLLAAASEKLINSLTVQKINTSILSGPVTDCLIALAKDYSCDLIVMGSQGRTGVGRILMGSVAESVLRQAPCSVQIVRRKTT
jgi:nucleotide-binding universal stress UspA family protein